MGIVKRGSRKRRRWWFLLEIIVILGVIAGIRAWQQRTLISGEAPLFVERTMSGSEIALATYQGKPVLLHFWASWCGMCELAQGAITKIERDWPVITVAYRSGDEDSVRAYMEKQDIQHWVTIIDHDGDLADQYGVVAVPTSYVVDKSGQIRFREVGLSSSWGLRVRLWLAAKLRSASKELERPPKHQEAKASD